MRYSSISAIGTFTAVNTGTGDFLRLIPAACSGGEDADLRTTIENAPGTGGVLAFPPLDGAQIITLSGLIEINSTGVPSAYFAAVDAVIASLKTALNAMKAAPDDLVHSGGTLSVWKYSKLDTALDGITQSVTFGLVVDG